MTTIEITDQMVDRAERWLCGHDAWELPYGSTGSGEAARTILEAALADPPVRGSADGLIEPGPPKVDVKQATENNIRLYGLLKGRMAGLEEDFLEFTDTTERDLEAFSVDLQKLSQEMTALRERVDRIQIDCIWGSVGDMTKWVASLTPHQRDYVRLCLAEERAEAAGEA